MNLVNAFLALGRDPLYVFMGLVGLDILLGVANAFKTKTFDGNKFPSFLRSQFGTVQFLVVAGAAFASYMTGGDVKQAATAVVVAGGGALTISIFKDIFEKAKALLGLK